MLAIILAILGIQVLGQNGEAPMTNARRDLDARAIPPISGDDRRLVWSI
jgi:hypothetical protein